MFSLWLYLIFASKRSGESRAKQAVRNEVMALSTVSSCTSRAQSCAGSWGQSSPLPCRNMPGTRGSVGSSDTTHTPHTAHRALLSWASQVFLFWGVFGFVLAHGHISPSGENGGFGKAEVCRWLSKTRKLLSKVFRSKSDREDAGSGRKKKNHLVCFCLPKENEPRKKHTKE